ncbi:MAG: serine/threonine-protein kinase [Pirellulaceae bacterium]
MSKDLSTALMNSETQKLIERIEKSGLMSANELGQISDNIATDSVHEFGEQLIAGGHLTEWQLEKLVAGKIKGFFLGSYRVNRLIGRGGHSKVYEVVHETLQQRRVIKVLLDGMNNGKSSMLSRFILEARALAKLTHPNIVQCLDIVNQKDMNYLVMEYLDGSDLEDLVKNRGPLPFAEAVGLVEQIATGLHYANENGFIHRDVKPRNVFLTSEGVVKILDFGLMLMDQPNKDASLTMMHDDSLGTPDYIAPEQAVDSHKTDVRSDIYSLGCTFYFLLTGRQPFPEGTAVQRIVLHQTRMPERVAKFRRDCPLGLERIVWKMIQKKPEKRYQDYPTLITALKNWESLSSESSSTTAILTTPIADVEVAAVTVADPLFVDDPFAGETMGSPLATNVWSQPEPNAKGGRSPARSSVQLSSRSKSGVRLGGKQGTNTKQVAGGKRAKSIPTRSRSGNETEEEAYQRFLRRERLKMLWVLIGVLLGVGIAVGVSTVMFSVEKIQSENKAPIDTSRE